MLYTIKKSFATHEIKREEHLLYLEEYGNLTGVPILFLHGGPGSGCGDWQKALFNNKVYRVIFYLLPQKYFLFLVHHLILFLFYFSFHFGIHFY